MGLNLLVTGAGGFLGQAVVTAAMARGHWVRAIVRRETTLADGAVAEICDLGRDAIDLTGIDAVIHCAAALSGDDAAQERDTVAPTRALVAAIAGMDRPPRLVLTSSLSVYEYRSLASGSTLTEHAALETDADSRDAYTRAKLAQEAVAQEALTDLWLIRAGLIYGPGRVWNAHLGVGIGPMLVRIGGTGELPLIHLTDCAEAMVLAAETPIGEPRPLNLIGDDLPDRSRFITAFRSSGWPKVVVPLPWQILDAVRRLLRPFPGLPGLLRPASLRARMMPLRYVNDAAKSALGWKPQIPFDAGIAAALKVTR
ncbi:NAD-dependent epimerase/dehydratase family protein [Flavimaricola marinus]|uniref:3 beta-hydroxysteroid dehydrogenase/Delta 5-->4-isomerase n=1 Tax=Flavimaricola marinus TaxID=1819565 RepID=A0A238LB27_9RHOB|nr:NAD(P)-dependent oxidoreductase [Flavimaricola marinus]SMY06879.1 3 beta-hydroxysteroid dehydrogenase/Delta 5-->4-isomerase [Flavimaricola marinus]